MTAIDDLLAREREHPGTEAERRPARRLAVVTCMDARIDLFRLLGLRSGEAHILRNAGGVVTPDTIRSLVLSQRALGTREVMLIHHTDCGLHGLSGDAFLREIEAEVGMRPDWAVEAFDDVDADVRQSIARVRATPFLPHRGVVRGFVYDVHAGSLREVAA